MSSEFRDAEQFLLSLHAAWKNLGLYSPTHPAATTALQNLRSAFEKLLGAREQITLGLLHDTLVIDGVPLTTKPELYQNFMTRLEKGEIQGLALLNGCTLEELRHLVELLGRNVKRDELEQEFKRRGVSHILIVQLSQDGAEPPRKVEVVEERVGAGAIYSRALQTIRKVFQEVRFGKVPSVGDVQRTVEDMVGGILKGKHSLMALTMIKSYDEYLFNHSVNVGILTMALGETMGLDVAALKELGLGALLHDLGKINIPETIIRAPRKLTDEQPHPYSMIVHVADTYDAMTTVRVYSGPADPNQAISRMKKLAGTALNPLTLDSFVDMLGIYPPGTAVRLNTAEIGVVTRPGGEDADAARPWVRIVQD